MKEILVVRESKDRISVNIDGSHVDIIAGIALALKSLKKQGTPVKESIKGIKDIVGEMGRDD